MLYSVAGDQVQQEAEEILDQPDTRAPVTIITGFLGSGKVRRSFRLLVIAYSLAPLTRRRALYTRGL